MLNSDCVIFLYDRSIGLEKYYGFCDFGFLQKFKERFYTDRKFKILIKSAFEHKIITFFCSNCRYNFWSNTRGLNSETKFTSLARECSTKRSNTCGSSFVFTGTVCCLAFGVLP